MARKPVTSPDDLDDSPSSRSLVASSERVVELRRIEVIRRRLRGETITGIADTLGCSVGTVNNDIKAIRESNNKLVEQFDQEDYVGDTLQTFKKIEEEAWRQVFALDVGDSRKAKFLDSIRSTRKEAVKLLQSSGLLHKEAQKVEVQVTSEVISNWSSDQKMLVADALVEAAIIDADFTESEEEEFNSMPIRDKDLKLEDIAEFLDE
jgi:transposase